MALIPNYNLEIENYKEKHNLPTLRLSLEAKLQDEKVFSTNPAW